MNLKDTIKAELAEMMETLQVSRGNVLVSATAVYQKYTEMYPSTPATKEAVGRQLSKIFFKKQSMDKDNKYTQHYFINKELGV